MKKTYHYITIPAALIVFSLTSATFAQVSQQWVRTYNGPGNSNDEAYSIAIDASGNVYVTGTSIGSGTSRDYATVKYNPLGVQQWAVRYNGPGNSADFAESITIDGSGNVYVTGRSVGSGTQYDYATIKYNSSGTQQWVSRYNGPGNFYDEANSIAVDISGNVYVTGYSDGSGTDFDYATIKYNSSGAQQWVRRYNWLGNSIDQANSIAVDISGNAYVTGCSVGSGTQYDYATIKYNSSGTQQWVSRYNGPGNSADQANSIAVTGTGTVYVIGCSGDDYATIKYNSSGVQQWAARYNGPGNNIDIANALAIDGSGNLYVTGHSIGSGTDYDYATIKYNSSGSQQWVKRYNGPGNDADLAYSIAVTGTDAVYVTGYSFGSGTDYDYATLKYNSSGVQQWVQRYNGSGNSADQATSMAVDASGNVYVAGYSTGTNQDYATIKYHDDALPVEIAYFNSSVKDNIVTLSWGTTWELNNSGFRVERQQAGGNNWSDIGFVQGNGTTNEAKDYTFTDNKLTKGNYKYRLKQIDYNGNYEYHTLNTDVTVGTPQNFDISQNYPNPSNPKSKIDFNIPLDGKVSLKVYDITGKEVAVLADEFRAADFYSVEFDGSKLSSGIYFYNISSGSFFETRKMVLIK